MAAKLNLASYGISCSGVVLPARHNALFFHGRRAQEAALTARFPTEAAAPIEATRAFSDQYASYPAAAK